MNLLSINTQTHKVRAYAVAISGKRALIAEPVFNGPLNPEETESFRADPIAFLGALGQEAAAVEIPAEAPFEPQSA